MKLNPNEKLDAYFRRLRVIYNQLLGTDQAYSCQDFISHAFETLPDDYMNTASNEADRAGVTIDTFCAAMKDHEARLNSRKDTTSQLAMLTQTPEQALLALQATQASLLNLQGLQGMQGLQGLQNLQGFQGLANFGGLGTNNAAGVPQLNGANWNTNANMWCAFHNSNTHNTAPAHQWERMHVEIGRASCRERV